MPILLWFRRQGFVFWFLSFLGVISLIGLVGMFTAIAESQGVISFRFLKAKPDLALTISATPPTATRNDPLTYTLRVTNEGPGEAKKIVVDTALPDGVMFVSAEPGNPACFEAQSVVNCRLGALNSSEHVEAIISVTVSESAPRTLVADSTVETSVPEPNTSNNSATVSTPVR